MTEYQDINGLRVQIGADSVNYFMVPKDRPDLLSAAYALVSAAKSYTVETSNAYALHFYYSEIRVFHINTDGNFEFE